MLTIQQERKNKEWIDDFEAQISAQKQRIEEYLRFSVDSALEYTCSESTVDDWLDVYPEAIPKSIVQLQRHAKAACQHMSKRSKEETTASLRTYTEQRFTVSFIYQS